MTAALADLAVVLVVGVAGFAVGALWMLRRQALGYRAAKSMLPYLTDRRVWLAVGRNYVSRRLRAVRTHLMQRR